MILLFLSSRLAWQLGDQQYFVELTDLSHPIVEAMVQATNARFGTAALKVILHESDNLIKYSGQNITKEDQVYIAQQLMGWLSNVKEEDKGSFWFE